MARQSNQKLKILYLLKILMQETDEAHPMPMPALVRRLTSFGISAERKSVYGDIETLNQFGFDILLEPGKGYYMASRSFELPELKLLVDSVQASRFITEKKSNQLIKKLEGLTSVHLAQTLQRQVYTAERAKTLNEAIYYSVDKLHDAIYGGKKVAFLYYEYTPDKQRVLKNGGAEYVISPYSLNFSDENYYVISRYPKYSGLTHFRVDRMSDIRILDEPADDIREASGERFHLGEYSRKVFSMYGGQTRKVELLCDNSLVNPVIDRFGEGVYLHRAGSARFLASASVNVSPTFFAWVCMFEGKMQIVGPEDVAAGFDTFLENNQKAVNHHDSCGGV